MSNSKETIAIVEDEESLGEGLRFNFELEGYTCVWLKDGVSALSYLEANHADLAVVILDLMLPGMDGFDVLRNARRFAEKTPILVLSAKGAEKDRVAALELGADDFVTKPFSLQELLLRVRGLAKKRHWYTPKSAEHDQIPFGTLWFRQGSLLLTDAQGATVARVSPMEGLLIQNFVESPNQILSRAELLERVWQLEGKLETRTVDVFVGKLRKYLDEPPANPRYLLSVRGVGYAYVTTPEAREQVLGRPEPGGP